MEEISKLYEDLSISERRKYWSKYLSSLLTLFNEMEFNPTAENQKLRQKLRIEIAKVNTALHILTDETIVQQTFESGIHTFRREHFHISEMTFKVKEDLCLDTEKPTRRGPDIIPKKIYGRKSKKANPTKTDN